MKVQFEVAHKVPSSAVTQLQRDLWQTEVGTTLNYQIKLKYAGQLGKVTQVSGV
jgi:hypothetical protein